MSGLATNLVEQNGAIGLGCCSDPLACLRMLQDYRICSKRSRVCVDDAEWQK